MKLITEGMLQEMGSKSREIVLESGSRLTPSAKDYATMMGLTIIQEHDRYITRESKRLNTQHEEQSFQAPSAPQTTERLKPDDEVDMVVKRVLAELKLPEVSCASGFRAAHVRGDSIQIHPFATGQPGLKMGLANVITSRDANLAAGFMTFDNSELPWHMTYDEVDYVIEGDYVLQIDHQEFRARPGDVIYIPKGAQVVFSSPGFAKVFYVTYPANWDELART